MDSFIQSSFRCEANCDGGYLTYMDFVYCIDVPEYYSFTSRDRIEGDRNLENSIVACYGKNIRPELKVALHFSKPGMLTFRVINSML
jgi:hypothetical protein